MDTHLSEGGGTLIIEQANKAGARFWWTEDDIMAVNPDAKTNWDKLDGYITGKTENPFVHWCFEKYVSIKTGKASLPHCLEPFPPGPVESKFFQGLYPKAKIVQTLLLRKNR